MLERCFAIKELAEMIGAEVKGNQELQIAGLATLQDATDKQLSFLANPVYQKYLSSTKAAAVILSPKAAASYEGACLITDNPYLAYAKLSALWDPVCSFAPSVSNQASISTTAQIGENVFIGAGARIGDEVSICEGAYVGENTVVSSGSFIGKGTKLYPNVTVYHGVKIGDNCTVQAGCVIGSDGFGFAPNGKTWQRISQLGGVVIGDRVEIGANTCIDRGALGNTVIEDGVILDNQIQIAHNVFIGENTAIAACSAVAGSTKIGKNCIVGGASGIAGHLEIADGVHITAMTMVIKSLPEPGVYSSGTGVQPNKEWKRSIARLRRLDSTESRLKEIEKQLNSMNKNQDA